MKKRILHLSLCLLMLLIGGCAAHQPGATAKNTADTPFERTGLMAYPGERPEEILVRAHGGDVRAMALVIAGYYFGMGGFPQDRHLAVEWNDEVFWTAGAVRAATFFLAMTQTDMPVAERTVDRLASCEFGKESFFAPLFKDAGIFDIEARCREFADAPVEKGAAWATQYQKSQTFWQKCEKDCRADMALLRGLHTRLATPDDVNLLKVAATSISYRKNIRRYLLYIATTHDPERESPDWSDVRLANLMARKKDIPYEFRELIKKAFFFHATFEPSPALDSIRRAHAGDNDAALLMARSYAGGEMGFPPTERLVYPWLLRGGDRNGSRLMAAYEAHRTYPVDAWIWAESAKQSGDSAICALAAVLQKRIEEKDGLATVRRAHQLLQERRASMNEPVSAAPHVIAMFENNAFKELKPASDIPEDMRYRDITEKRDNGEIVERKVPVARIEMFLMDKNGKPATPDTAVRITVHDYALDGTLLHSNTMTKKGGGLAR